MSEQSTQNQAVEQQRRTPILLKKLLGKIHASARDIGNPESFNGIMFYNAVRMDSDRENSYHVELRNSYTLSESQLTRIHAILNEQNTKQSKKPNNQKYRKPHQKSNKSKSDEPFDLVYNKDKQETKEFVPKKNE